MADILLQRPAEGTSTFITPNGDERLVFGFEPADVTLTRDDDNLVLTFDEDTVLTLTDFYLAYTSENMPTFMVGEEEISGEVFFAAFEDLMPAAGSAGSTPQGGGTTVDTITVNLEEASIESLLGNAGTGFVIVTPESQLGFATDSPTLFVEGATVATFSSAVTPAALVDSGDVEFTPLKESGVTGETGAPNTAVVGVDVLNGQLNVSGGTGTLTYELVGDGQGVYGSITLNEDGSFTYILDNNDVDTQALAQGGETGVESFSFVVRDSAGQELSITVGFDITGTNDRPSLSFVGGATDGATKIYEIDEDALTPVEGKMRFDDVDAGDSVTLYLAEGNITQFAKGEVSENAVEAGDDVTGAVIEGAYGTMTLLADGSYSYALNADKAQTLGDETYEEKFTVYAKDEQGSWTAKNIIVEVKGSNDAPVISTWHEGNHLWNNVGMYGETDADGYKNLVATGNLLEGVERNGVVKDQVTDSEGDELFFAVGAVGADNKAPITLSEDIEFATAESVSTIEGTYGTLTITADGTYTYSVEGNEAYAALSGNEGQKSEFFTVYVKDEHGAWTAEEIKISLKGQNDAPVIELSDGNFDLKESGVKDKNHIDSDGPNSVHNGDPKVIGSFVVSDVDGNGGYKIITEDKLGDDYVGIITFEEGADGKFEFAFNLNNDSTEINALDDADRLSLNITLNASDGSDKLGSVTLPVVVYGTNDRPSLSFVGGSTEGPLKIHQVTEDATPEKLGQMKASDVDADDADNLTFFIASGHITQFAQGEVPDTAVEVTDEKDATLSSEYGIFSMKADGSYTFTPNENAQSLGKGDNETAEFTIYVKDTDGAWVAKNVEIQITGSNDAPVFVSSETDGEYYKYDYETIAEGSAKPVTGSFAVIDDAGDTHTYSMAIPGQAGWTTESQDGSTTILGKYGTFVFETNAETGKLDYTYTLYTAQDVANNPDLLAAYEAVQNLDDSQSLQEAIYVSAQDQDGAHTEKSMLLKISIDGKDGVHTKEILTLEDARGTFAYKEQNILVDEHAYFNSRNEEAQEVSMGKGNDVVHLRAEHAMNANGFHAQSDNLLNTGIGSDIVNMDTKSTAMYANTMKQNDAGEWGQSVNTATNTVDTDDGRDEVYVTAAAGSAMLANGEGALNKISTGQGNDVVSIVADESLHALRANRGGSNEIYLGKDDDSLHIDGKIVAIDSDNSGSMGQNILDGGLGADTLSLENTFADDTYTLSGKASDFTIEGAAEVKNFEKLVFGDANDIIDASGITEGKMNIDGGAGDDTITGGAGYDSLFGGDGDDVIFGDLNDLAIKGGDGNDIIVLPNINDVLEMDIDGGAGIDILLTGIDSEATHEQILNSTVQNIDILMYGDEAAAKELHAGLANVTDGDIRQELANGEWKASDTSEYTSKNGITYREYVYKDEETTILVNTSLLGN